MFNVEEAQRSNVLISGTNGIGKSLWAMSLASKLQRLGWKVIAVDNVGIWKDKSDIKTIQFVVDNKIKTPTESIIYDISFLKIQQQRKFVEALAHYLWQSRVNVEPNQWVMLILEEAQLYMRNVRGKESQELLRIMTAGRNRKIRCTAIVPDLAILDSVFIRLTLQRYHFKLAIEENGKRKFRNYYGKDFCRIATEGLDVGDCLYVLNERIQIIHVPEFRATIRPTPIWQKRVIP